MRDSKRYFTIGSEWLYYKLYMGSKTSEQFLTSKLLPFADQLLKHNIIDKWFFINYYDTDRHIRIRFHFTEPKKGIPIVIDNLNKLMEPLVNERLLSDIVVGTYKREIERYGGIDTIEHFESLFHFNSELILKVLLNCDDQPEKRWLWGIKTIDYILDDWGADLPFKHQLFESLKNSFGREMGVNSNINKQLSSKFRENRKKINSILENGDQELQKILIHHKTQTAPVIENIKKNKKQELFSESLMSILSSYIHMHYNRLFSSRQRMNEWVMYYFLHQYYRSKIAQNKQHKK